MTPAKTAMHLSDSTVPPPNNFGLSQIFGPIRVRLALLVLIAAVPLLILSATIAWQNYHLALEASAASATQLRESALARHASAIAGAEQMMQALSQVAELTGADTQACHDRLSEMLALQAARYSNLVAADAGGARHCGALPPPEPLRQSSAAARNAPLFALARAKRGFAMGPVRTSPITSGEIIPAVYPIIRNADIIGFVFAGLRIDWFGPTAGSSTPQLRALWMVDSDGHVTQLASSGPESLPPPGVMRRLQSGPDVIEADSASGQPYAYAPAALGDGYRLIVAYPATNDQQAAHHLLILRICQLGVLTVLGLGAVAIGAHAALVQPLAELSRTVTRWRLGGPFDAGRLRDPPTEVRDLAASFAEATQSLAEHEARHKLAMEQQELLMREIHHRVKNNLQIVASLLNLQASRIRQPEAKAEFASARDRVRALATLHRHLYIQGEVHTIDMPSFLKELCGQLFQAMGETAGQRIKLTIDASALQMSSDQAVPLSLIVTEAISNALKYAFPGGRAGHIAVSLIEDGDYADLTIQDDGVGIEAARAEVAAGTRDGIGMTLIKGFARQLGGTLTIEEEAGTRYSLRMKLLTQHPDTDEPHDEALAETVPAA